MSDDTADRYLRDWTHRQHMAEDMVPLLGRLYRDRGVIVTVFGQSLVNKSPLEIIQLHRKAGQMVDGDIPIEECLPILEAISQLDLAPARIDIGNLLTHMRTQQADTEVAEFVKRELAGICTGLSSIREEPQDVVLYGFGRIGRLIARILVGKAGRGDNLRLRAVVVRGGGSDDLEKRASLLRRDSVHGHFDGTIHIDEHENALVANGTMIRVLYSDGPDKIDYTQYGIRNAIVVDNTGIWRTLEDLRMHLKSPGAASVVLTAPGKGDVPNIVYGVNHQNIAKTGPVISAASCTTNAIVPVLKTVSDEFGIVSGHVESVHSFTNDQNLIDNYHRKDRRGRAATLNMVITETGAAKAVAKAVPELAGKLTGNAIRVPTPNVSLAILNLHLGRELTVDEVNSYLRMVSLESDLQNQIDYVNSSEVVSSDFVGNRFAGIVDAQATIVNGAHCTLYVWYDNEFGYSRQVVRLLEELAGVVMPNFPKRACPAS
ncbi:MAG: glyceraldehyde-3-phosphate dehydrogenase [Deltaproteobacteria bacterium]|nr:glyceraldehyde-3-phosphate dehydrogenase [Deltaproteobacteria bacterium]